MERVVQLSSVNLNTSAASVIEFLMDKDRPIFFRVPDNKNAWVIKRASDVPVKWIQGIIKASKTVRSVATYSGAASDKEQFERDLQKITDVQLIKGVSYGCLGANDLFILLTHKNLRINKLDLIMIYDTGGKLSLAVENRRSQKSNIQTIDDKPISRTLLKSASCGEILFTNKTVDYWAKDNSTLNDIVGIDITFDSLVVYESDILNFIHNDLDSIPNDSPYYIPKDLRNQSDLDQLAALGYQLFSNNCKSKITSKDLAAKIERTLGYSGKKAVTAAYFLIPNPKGNNIREPLVNDNANPDCKFPFLVKAFALHGIHIKTEDTSKVNSLLITYFNDHNFSEDNVKYAEIILRKKVRVS
ncbi:Uncharacterised protein [Shewanella putrefaciens]|uniref:hypothetical protein n=1 Tax=Shewanella sp. GD04112 TaxID=2975434 RepID=UPI000F6D808B|nr:hypothetical protein [Shewanella sp. GD04112]MDH0448419.1 hypothetical protein [Shewanella sp. GD04112]VEE64008.1 Uncharacterised protein [Shewanella putrefaciens]